MDWGLARTAGGRRTCCFLRRMREQSASLTSPGRQHERAGNSVGGVAVERVRQTRLRTEESWVPE